MNESAARASRTTRMTPPIRKAVLERRRSRSAPLAERTPSRRPSETGLDAETAASIVAMPLPITHARIEQRVQQVDQQGGGGDADNREDGHPHDHVEVGLQDSRVEAVADTWI